MTLLKLDMDPRLVRMPEDHWNADLSSHAVGEFVRIDLSIGPEGFLTRMVCSGCSKKRAILVRPAGRIHTMLPAIRAATRNGVVREHMTQWVARHGRCPNAGREVVVPEPFAGYVSRLRAMALTRLEAGRPPASVLMLTSRNESPELFDCRDVFAVPAERRFTRGCRLVAALRDRIRESDETFTSAITYREEPGGSGGPPAEARIDIETPRGLYSGQAPIHWGAGGRGAGGRGADAARDERAAMGEFVFGAGRRSLALDDVFVIETPL